MTEEVNEINETSNEINESLEQETLDTPEVVDAAEEPEAIEPQVDEKTEEQSNFDKRIHELTRKAADAQRERDEWKKAAMSRQQEEVKTPEPEPIKTLEDFDYDDSQYSAYMLNLATETSKASAVEEARRVLSEEQRNAEVQLRRSEFSKKEAEYAKNLKDYEQVARSNDLHITQDMGEMIMESDRGPEVLYYLGKNPDIAAKIATLAPITAAREMGKIEAKLETPKAEPTKTPPPPPKIPSGESELTKSLDDMDDDEYAERRRKYIEKHR